MAKIQGTIPLSGKLAPTDDQDNFAITEDTYNQGGHRTVGTIAERNNIPTERKKEGMLVFVISDSVTYQLINGFWEVFAGSSGAGDKHETHEQNVAESTWNIQHNLGKFPSVAVIDSGGSNVEGEIIYVDANNIQLIFSASFTGKAYMN
ncbi:MAG TPA: hypothetical protein ENK70_01120 [Methylophaga sp.]|nr:hypothetical protein [Methylophaga sp.]